MRGVRKRFGSVQALSGVDLSVGVGEVHALVGENGAGKSTLMKILAGALLPDAGQMSLDGRAYAPASPLAAQLRGVAMIYQELTLADDLSVVDNVLLGREPKRLGFRRRSEARARARAALAQLGREELCDCERVAELASGDRQLVEVARALSRESRVVVMDEPTSSLSAQDAERLFAAIDRLRGAGVAVIYISHFLEEVLHVADRYTVLRDGASVRTGAIGDTSQDALIEDMVGRPLAELYPRVAHALGEVVLSIEGLAGRERPRGASLSLRRGELLGLAGLVGAGRSELVRAVFGLEPVRAGRIKVANVTDGGRPPWVRLTQGVGFLSEDRKGEGLSLAMTIADNLTLSHLERSARFGFMSRARQRRRAETWLASLGVRAAGPDAPALALSGGNQQKVALARLLDLDVDVLLLDEPTRGVDVASKAEIYRLVGELAAQGKAVLLVSSYMPELLGVCDRVAVMHRGTLLAPRPVAELSLTDLMKQATAGAMSEATP